MAEKLTTLAKRLRPFINGQVGAIAATGAYMTEGPGIDLVGNRIGLGGDTILVINADGSPVEEYVATEAGIDQAFIAADSGDTVSFPYNIVIPVTAGKTLPAGAYISGPNLSFSGFSGTAITMSTGSSLSTFNIAYNGAGQASALGVYANGVQCSVSNGRALAYNATTNRGFDLKGADKGSLRINAQNITGECFGGTTNHGITIRDHIAARDIYGEVHDGNCVGIRTEIGSIDVDDWIVNGWGNAPSGGAAYGVQVASGAARLIGLNCYGSTSGLRIESSATAYSYGCRANTITNLGTILGETFVDSTSMYIDDEASLYGAASDNVVLRAIENNRNTKFLITPKGNPGSGDTALHLYHRRQSEGSTEELFFGMGAAHGIPAYLFGTGDALAHGNMLDILFFTENGASRTDVMRLDAAGWMTFLKHFDVEEIAAPANPPANTARVYSRDDSGTTKLYYKRSDGTEIELGATVVTHDAVTLDIDAATILDLQGAGGQEIGLDVQNANTVWAGPTTGAADEPTFRALVTADLPQSISVDLPYGSFSSNATQTIASATTAYAITYTDREVTNQVTLSDNSKINIDVAGTYLITFSAVGKSAVANKYLDIWLAVDGNNVARSNTHSKFVGSANERIITVTYIYDFTAGQYFELYMHSDDTGTTLTATAAGASPTRPASPSIIVTVNKISDANPDSFLLLESGDRLLLETGDKLMME